MDTFFQEPNEKPNLTQIFYLCKKNPRVKFLQNFTLFCPESQ